MKPHPKVTEVMRASNLLYVYARMHQTIHACRQVSVSVLRSAVREWACCLLATFTILYLTVPSGQCTSPQNANICDSMNSLFIIKTIQTGVA